MDNLTEYVNINGIETYFLHYLVPNCQKVVIFVHGGPGHSTTPLAYYYQDLIDFTNVVYYDQRCAGKTYIKNKKEANPSLTLDDHIADLDAVVDYVKEKYGTSEVFLLCHSWGTVIGTQYAIKYPEKIAGYIGVGQVVNTRLSERESFNSLLARCSSKDAVFFKENYGNYPFSLSKKVIKEINAIRTAQDKYGIFYTNPSLDYRKLVKNIEIGSAKDYYVADKTVPLHEKLLLSVFEYDITKVKEYQCPIYYLLGEKDYQVSTSLASRYFATFKAPKKELIIVENAGHMTFLEQKEKFVEGLRKILGEDSPADEEETAAEAKPTEETVAEEKPVEETVAEEKPVEETVTEEKPVEETVTKEKPVEETAAEETIVEETETEEKPVEETATEQTPVEETATEQTPVEETATEQTPIEETATEEKPVEETAIEETPVEETAIEETSEDKKTEGAITSE